jgi:Domain of unknown function (DUF4082)/Secretion system C-terminal sorting domain
MKRTFYPSTTTFKRFIILFYVVVFLYGVSANAQTYTIGFVNPPPAASDPTVDQNDGVLDAIETGVRFRVTQPGTVTGIRFYKGTGVLGTHIGHLWTNNGGTQLASATFSESASGWQEVAVSVHIAAGTNFVASVFSSVGDYAAEPYGSFNWLTYEPPTSPADFGTAPIKVIRTPNDPAGNGLFLYLSNPTSGAFPTTVNSNNFWIDVRFQPDFSLPVSLSDFRATPTNTDVLVSWKTDHEFYNRGFEIQRSNNGYDWYAVSFVNGAGESTVTKNYSYTDKGLAPGSYHYRLKQSDIDGKNTFSAIVTATVSGKGKVSLFQNFPNPFSGSAKIRFDLPERQHARLTIVDLSGREVKVLTDKLSEAGSHIINLDASNLRPQVYLVTLRTANAVLTKKISVK